MKVYILGILRIAMGWTFLWAFLDKMFGLGFSTTAEQSWLNGVSPAAGFLKSATSGPLANIFSSMSGQPIVDWLFMMGLLLVGLSLILGIAIKISSISGSLMMLLIFLSAIPPENNPLIDQHIIYILVLLLLNYNEAGNYIGLGRFWSRIPIVQKYKWLK